MFLPGGVAGIDYISQISITSVQCNSADVLVSQDLRWHERRPRLGRGLTRRSTSSSSIRSCAPREVAAEAAGTARRSVDITGMPEDVADAAGRLRFITDEIARVRSGDVAWKRIRTRVIPGI